MGRFGTDGRGLFHGEGTHDGKAVPMRFVWSGITGSAARREQAFSVDDARTWLTNRVMELSRR
ncbi:hypothetical protein [Streptomyces xantholiticus]|uniref:hypothetical protein n=1 Tax=Streptomyces xantholiticus TaxID=68285 RepID=UPI001674F548|nr:hypothetical protein [Streptomyces xantholiticus]